MRTILALLLSISAYAWAAPGIGIADGDAPATCDPQRAESGKIYRSRKAIRAFRAENPCPATGETRGVCPGHHVDHIKPLCACGADDPSNMQWITKEDHKAKTRQDVRGCRVR